MNSWKFVGDYRVKSYSKSKTDIEKYCAGRESVVGILFLECKQDIAVDDADSKKPKSTPENRKNVEIAAINYVTKHFEEAGYTVIDHQKDNLGFDLLATKEGKNLELEVKGTQGSEQRFFLSRNERRKSIDPYWRLAIVSNALTDPQLQLYTTAEMEETFDFEPLSWACSAK